MFHNACRADLFQIVIRKRMGAADFHIADDDRQAHILPDFVHRQIASMFLLIDTMETGGWYIAPNILSERPVSPVLLCVLLSSRRNFPNGKSAAANPSRRMHNESIQTGWRGLWFSGFPCPAGLH